MTKFGEASLDPPTSRRQKATFAYLECSHTNTQASGLWHGNHQIHLKELEGALGGALSTDITR